MNAKAHLEKAIALNPDFAEAYYKLGLLLKEEGDPEAQEYFRKAVSLNSEYAEAECELAIALVAQKDFETARNHFLNALEILSLIHISEPTRPY